MVVFGAVPTISVTKVRRHYQFQFQELACSSFLGALLLGLVEADLVMDLVTLMVGHIATLLLRDITALGPTEEVMLKNDILAIRFKEFEYYGGGHSDISPKPFSYLKLGAYLSL